MLRPPAREKRRHNRQALKLIPACYSSGPGLVTMPDILFILVLALVIFGPKRLPEVMRQVAKFMAQFRMMRDDLKRQLEGEMLKIELEERQKQKTVATPAPTAQLPVTTAPPSESVPTSQSSSALDGNISATG